MKIGYIDNPNDQQWMDFVSSHKRQASIFHHPAWIETLATTYGYRPFVITVMEDGNIQTGLPFLEMSGPFSEKKWIALPFTDYCQPLGGNSEHWSILINEIERAFRDGEVPKVEVRWDAPMLTTYKTQDDVLHILKLDPDYKKIEANFHLMHFNNIKRAQRNKVEIVVGKDLEHLRIFYRMHILTRKRHGIPVQPWRFFENLNKFVIMKGLGCVMLARHEGEWIAGGVYLHYGNTLTYKYAASLEKSLRLRPNNLIFAKAIQWGCKNKFSILDMGKTSCSNTGLRNFKSRWGAIETPLRYSFFSSRQPSSQSLQDRLMPVLRIMLQNSPALFTKVFGEIFYGYFP